MLILPHHPQDMPLGWRPHIPPPTCLILSIAYPHPHVVPSQHASDATPMRLTILMLPCHPHFALPKCLQCHPHPSPTAYTPYAPAVPSR
ncbi:hypothetical protein O181_017195 [Austropuccinia psidii MF-1]|uniref:Uncharacterized protein n=1 Tax=Austropuccinia psidii MF-1 TaxID=1389203 RepID=A0A9Q3C7B7_9BASI|nr:hypothetical protein [Austropuccinia psidii MF-1]